MTACTNHGGKARRVVTAALVGVLSVGTVPMVALAEGVSDGISTLALEPTEAFAEGTMTRAEDNEGRSLTIPSDGIITVAPGKQVVPTQVAPKDAESDPVDLYYMGINTNEADKANARIQYNGTQGTNLDSQQLKTPGRYTIEVTVTKGDYQGAKFTIDFIVEDAGDLSNATIFDNSNNANDVTDTTFTYNGKVQKVGVAVNGKVVPDDEYSLVINKKLNADGSQATGTILINDTTNPLKDAGTYLVDIKNASGVVVAKATFVINSVDLSKANLVVGDIAKSDVQGSTTTINTVEVDGVEFTTADVHTVTDAVKKTGKASVTVTPADGRGNITGEAKVEFNVVDKVLTDANVKYNDAAVTGGVTVNLADGESFKPERIEVFDNTVIPSKKLDASYYTVTYTDKAGNEVDASALQSAGEYTVHVRANAAASRFAYGSGDIKFAVNVTSATVEDSDIVFKFDGKVGTYFDPTYTGEDMLERLETIVHTKWGDDLVEGTDYTVQAYKGTVKDGEKVDSIVDAGEYTVNIELKGNYGNSLDTTCTIDVQKMEVSYVFARGGIVTEYTPSGSVYPVYYVSYTGSEIEPSFELGYYTDADGECTSSVSDSTWHALPADSYEVTGYSYKAKPADAATDADAMKDKGYYVVEFAFDGGNYDVSVDSTHNQLRVSDASVGFLDVDPNAWYAQAVYQAKQLGYVKGVSGSEFYAPEAQITRADALVIISRMSGFESLYGDNEDYLIENAGYVTRYNDVDPGAYYAQAIAWGTKMGIVSGYQDGSGKFGPTDPITREQFAGMLANYAKAAGKYSAADSSALGGYADASSVSSWATDAVAWAVENEVMGNNGALMGQNTITRGEVAAMAVNYQPEGISSEVIA